MVLLIIILIVIGFLLIHWTGEEDQPSQLEGELKIELVKMVRWATHGDRRGNPYRQAEVMSALRLLAKIEGISDPYEVNIEKFLED